MNRRLTDKFIRPANSIDDQIMPMINIVFLLLIFFMIAGKLATSDPFPLVLASSKSQTTKKLETVYIHLDGNGGLYIQHKPYPKPEFLNQIQSILNKGEEVELRIRADHGHKALEIVSMLVEMKAIGIEKVFIETQRATSE